MNKKQFGLLLLSMLVVMLLPMALVHANKIDEMSTAVEKAVLTIGGAVAIIGWVVAGIIYLTSGGDPGRTGIAKKAMIAAIVGTALVLIGSTADNVTEFIKDALGIEGELGVDDD